MIALSGVSKRYGSKPAVTGLTFEVRPGRVTGFLGPNGAGKSTTMRLILGLDRPDSGALTVNGRSYCSIRRPLHEVGSLLESAAVHPGRSAYGHLLGLARANGISAGRVSEVLGMVGLESVARNRIGGFSLGMTQRLGMAAALLGDPGVLLLDEPVNGLDPDGVAWIRRLLRSLAAEGRTVFVSSHLMSEMENTAEHVVVITQGRLVADEPLDEFTRRARTSRVLVRSFDQDRLAELLKEAGATIGPGSDGCLEVSGSGADEIGMLAARHGIVLRQLVTARASLEEAFMQLTGEAGDFRSSSPEVSA